MSVKELFTASKLYVCAYSLAAVPRDFVSVLAQ